MTHVSFRHSCSHWCDISFQESGDQNRSKAKQDVEQLLGKADKKKKKAKGSQLGDIDMVKALPAPLGLQKKPLPGIVPPVRLSSASSLSALAGGGLEAAGGGGGGGLLRVSQDAKVTSSLDGPHMSAITSSMGVSLKSKPLGSTPAPLLVAASVAQPLYASREDQADSKDAEVIRNDRADRKELSVEPRERDATDSDIGRLDVTASLASKSRVLGAGGKHRSALPSTGSSSALSDAAATTDLERYHREDKEQRSESKGTSEEETAYVQRTAEDYQYSGPSKTSNTNNTSTRGPSAAHPAGVIRKDNYGDSEYAPSSAGVSPQAASADLHAYKTRCAELEQRLKECEERVEDYRTSYNTAKEDLTAMERRYQSNQSQWVDRLRAAEVEKDKVESERRQLKLSLLDLESQAQMRTTPAVTSSTSFPAGPTSDVLQDLRIVNDRLAQEIAELQKQVQSADSALSRSATAHGELQNRLVTMEQAHQSRLAQAQIQCQEAKGECSKLAAELRATQRKCEALEAATGTAALDERNTSAAQLLALSNKDDEIAHLRTQLAEEVARKQSLLENRVTDAKLAESQVQKLAEEKTTLVLEAQALQSQLTIASQQISTKIAGEADLLNRVDAAEAQLRVEQRLLEELRAAEGALKRELGERDRRLSEQQEQILTLQAAKHMSSANSESDTQMEAFTSQATAVRKSLKAEIERQKVALQDLETEKSNLLTQLTRQETTLQFAKKELNGIATLRDDLRKAESEKQLLQVQMDTVRAAHGRLVEQEQALQMKVERLQQSNREQLEQQEDLSSALKRENETLLLSLDAEKNSVVQREKKIKSYQEELLQLQRRLAERASPVRSALALPSPLQDQDQVLSFSPVPFASDVAATAIAAEIADVRAQLLSKEAELKTANDQVVSLEQEVRGQNEHAAQLDSLVRQQKTALHDLTAQLRRKEEELEVVRASQGLLQDLQHLHSTAASSSAPSKGTNEEVLLAKYGSVLQAKELVEAEKSTLLIQVQELRSELASARSRSEVQAANVLSLNSDLATYKDKWVSAEKELVALRLQHAHTSRTLELQVSTLQDALQQAQAAGDYSSELAARELSILKPRYDELRSLVGSKDAMVVSLQHEVVRLKDVAARAVSDSLSGKTIPSHTAGPLGDFNKENVSRPAAAPAFESQQSQHIVTLSMEVGRQQANMERMEEHMRRTEQMLQDIRNQGQGSAAAASVNAAKSTAKEERAPQYVVTEPATESPESLSPVADKQQRGHRRHRSVGGSSSSSDGSSQSPVRNSKHSSRRGGKTVQFQPTRASKEGGGHRHRSSSAEDHDGVQLSQKLAILISEHDMDVHDCVSWSGRIEHGVVSRVVAEGRTRMKKEVAFLKELQALCATAKETISRDQAYVKNLKALWRNARNKADAGVASVVSTEGINAMTLKVNASVDELRAAQQMAKGTEARVKDLNHSLQHLQQVSGSGTAGLDSNKDQQMALDAARQVQQRCLDSAREMTASLDTLHPKHGHGPASSRVTSGISKPAAHPHPHAGVAFEPAAASAYHGIPSHGANDALLASILATVAPADSSVASTAAQRILQLQTAPAVFQAPTSPSRSSYQHQPLPAPTSMSLSMSGIRSAEVKTRILQDQISKITERQSLVKDVCDNHAG